MNFNKLTMWQANKSTCLSAMQDELTVSALQ
jgi:hypothetical protein